MVLLSNVRNPSAPAAEPARGSDRVPLVVDLDDTLLRSDATIETLFAYLRKRPLHALTLFAICWQGRAYLKRWLAQRVTLDVAAVPYRPDVLAHLREEQRRGRRLILATASDELIAREIARYLGLFDVVLASDGHVNLSGEHKRQRLVAQFGERGFDYIGDSRRDRAVWASARNVLAVNPPARMRQQLLHAFEDRTDRLHAYSQALRVHHWVKNSLVFLPLVLAHRLLEIQLWGRYALAFLAFSLCASSVYLLNDLLDLPADRAHPRKHARPIASGQIRLAVAAALVPLLLALAFTAGLQLPAAFLVIMGGYFFTIMLYSLGWKDIPILDVTMLALGYSARVAAGAVLLGSYPSAWLIAFCVCLFFSLAVLKRYTELLLMAGAAGDKAHARGYLQQDRTLLPAQGIAAGYLAVLVLALYTLAPAVHPTASSNPLLWILCLLLFCWINYMWLMAQRGRMHHDPVSFTLTDRISQCMVVAMGILIVLAV